MRNWLFGQKHFLFIYKYIWTTPFFTNQSGITIIIIIISSSRRRSHSSSSSSSCCSSSGSNMLIAQSLFTRGSEQYTTEILLNKYRSNHLKQPVNNLKLIKTNLRNPSWVIWTIKLFLDCWWLSRTEERRAKQIFKKVKKAGEGEEEDANHAGKTIPILTQRSKA